VGNAWRLELAVQCIERAVFVCLVDCRVDGKYAEDVPADELNAIIEDHLAM
jgi:hypothetical protein